MLSACFYYDWDYWNLRHKVTFDGENKLILVNHGVTELDWKADVYSAWKEWVGLSTHKQNAGYLNAMRVIGGDYITADGVRRVGATFFLTNGWRLRTWQGDHRLKIIGNVYTEEGAPIYVPTGGNYSIIIEQNVSTLVEATIVDGGSGGSGPTPEEIATAVWDRVASSHMNFGTFGLRMAEIRAMVESIANDTFSIKQKLNDATALIQTLMKYETNRTKIDQATKTLTIYDNDGVTILKQFDLKDFMGNPSITQIAERVPK